MLITYRHQIGGRSTSCMNVSAFLETAQSALEPERNRQSGTPLLINHDRGVRSDSGRTRWVETDPGRFVAVTCIDDDPSTAQICGYSFSEDDF